MVTTVRLSSSHQTVNLQELQKQILKKGILKMAKSKTPTIDIVDTMTVSVKDIEAVLNLFNTLDSELDDILECCDVNLSQVRTLREAAHKVSHSFNFRPQVGGDCGHPQHWLPKVLATDDKAWFYEGSE
jgi:hypothetical protein